jgi:Tfp pilus assembly protein PilO
MTSRDRPSLLAVLLLMTAAAVMPIQLWFLGVRPKRMERLDAASAELRELDNRIDMSRAAMRKYHEFQQAIRRLDLELAKLAAMLPGPSDENLYPALFRAFAEDDGVTLRAVRPRIAHSDVAYREESYDLDLEGRLDTLAEHLGWYERHTRIAIIPRIDLQRAEGNRWRATAVIILPFDR